MPSSVPSIPEISLAVIAAACVAAVAVSIPVLAQVRRTAARAERVLVTIDEALPGALAEVRELVTKLDRTVDTVGDLAQALKHLDRLAETAVRAVEQVGTAVQRTAQDVLVPSMAGAAGVLAALREGIQWVWPRHDRGRDDG